MYIKLLADAVFWLAQKLAALSSLLDGAGKFEPAYDGETITVNWTTAEYYMACCDCSLVHRLRFNVEGNNIHMTVYRDDKETASLRKKMHTAS